MGRKPWEVPYAERFANRKPKILLGFVSFADVYAEVFESTMAWAFQAGPRYRDKFEVGWAIATRREQYRARNALVKEAIEANADFIVFIDDDQTLSDAPDMLDRFYETEKPIQGGLYFQRTNLTLQPVIQRYEPATQSCRWMTMEELPKESGPVDILGGGLNWIDMTVFDFMSDNFWWPYPQDERRVYFKPHPKFGLDIQFCLKAREELGIQPWLNLDIQVGHVFCDRQVIRNPARPMPQICPTCDGMMHWHVDHWTCEICERQEPMERLSA